MTNLRIYKFFLCVSLSFISHLAPPRAALGHRRRVSLIPKILITRSSYQMCSLKKLSLKTSKFTAKHLCQSLFFNKVAGLSLQRIKKETLAHVFSCDFWEILEHFFYRTPGDCFWITRFLLFLAWLTLRFG